MLSKIAYNNGSYEYIVSPRTKKEYIFNVVLLYENSKDCFINNSEGGYGIFLDTNDRKLVQVWIKKSSDKKTIKHYCEELPQDYKDKLNLAIVLLKNL